MEKSVAIHQDSLFVALTRVPTIAGIAYLAFVAEGFLGSLIVVMTGNPLKVLYLLPLHAIFYVITAKDPGLFAEAAVWAKTNARSMNQRIWGGASFTPLQVKKWGN